MTKTVLTPIPLESVGAFRFAHETDKRNGTGVTVIIAPDGATGGVDVRGGAPASRETDLLRPENTVDQIHAVVLAGGSAYGLEAASGVARELEEHGIGLDVGVGLVPIVCSSCLFDLTCGAADVRPDMDMGRRAARYALDNENGGPLEEGCVGAGTGATVGKLGSPKQAMKSGLGARAVSCGKLRVGALSAVNACGNIVDPTTHTAIAGMRASATSHEIVDMEETLCALGTTATMPLDRTNTTISCIVTNARLTKAQATKIAQMAADAYAHTIRPTHTTNDGDTIYVLATGECDTELPLDLVGVVATRVLEQAIVAGVREATALFDLPAACDI